MVWRSAGRRCRKRKQRQQVRRINDVRIFTCMLVLVVSNK